MYCWSPVTVDRLKPVWHIYMAMAAACHSQKKKMKSNELGFENSRPYKPPWLHCVASLETRTHLLLGSIAKDVPILGCANLKHFQIKLLLYLSCRSYLSTVVLDFPMGVVVCCWRRAKREIEMGDEGRRRSRWSVISKKKCGGPNLCWL